MSEQMEILQKEIIDLKQSVALLQKTVQKEAESSKSATIMVFSNDFDKLIMAFSMASCAASMGIKVHMFFTFWGISALKKKNIYRNKTLFSKMMSWMLPANIEQTKLSKFEMLGMGRWMMRKIMKKSNMQSLSELVETARDLNVELIACTPSMQLLGIDADELIDGLSFCGCATFLLHTSHSHITWMI